MRKLAISAGLFAVISLGTPISAEQFVDAAAFDKGAKVILQGCVQPTAERDAFMLTRLTEWPIASSKLGKYGPRHYWVNRRTREFKDNVGNTLQVTGVITDVEESEIELEPGMRTFGTLIEVERPDRHILAAPESVGLRLARHSPRTDIKITLLKVDIDQVMRVMYGCLRDPSR
jgi:hypothetical protein